MNEKRTGGPYGADDLPPGRTDWERVRRQGEAEARGAAGSDPDNPPWTAEQLLVARLVMPEERTKEQISIRLDGEVLDYFRGHGPGYQSRINAVLLGYVRANSSRQSAG